MEQAGISTKTAFPMPITQTLLSEALGLTPIHVNRTLQVLKRDGVVSKIDKTIHVHNWDRLAAMADFNPAFLLINPPAAREAA